MAKTETLTVELPEELVLAMRGAILDGEYRSDNEVISDALMTWNAQRSPQDEDTARLQRAWQEAIDEGGPYVPMDEVFGPLKARYEAMVDAENKR